MTTFFIPPNHPLPELTLYQQPEPIAPMPIPWEIRYIRQRIPAGFPSPAAEYVEEGLDLNKYLITNHTATFMFTVIGDSMLEKNIVDGDKVTVDRSIERKHGQIVIAVVNNDYTIKQLYMRGGIFELRPANPKFQTIRFKEFDEVQIWGVVTGSVRKFRF